MTTALELLYKFLKIFNFFGSEFLKLIGDPTKEPYITGAIEGLNGVDGNVVLSYSGGIGYATISAIGHNLDIGHTVKIFNSSNTAKLPNKINYIVTSFTANDFTVKDTGTLEDLTGITCDWHRIIKNWQAGDFTNLNDTENGEGFVCATTTGNLVEILVGDFKYIYSGVFGENKTLLGQSVGATAGAVILQPPTGQTWDTFITGYTGTQNLKLPQLGIGTMRVESTLLVR